jgi:hypothetical protein
VTASDFDKARTGQLRPQPRARWRWDERVAAAAHDRNLAIRRRKSCEVRCVRVRPLGEHERAQMGQQDGRTLRPPKRAEVVIEGDAVSTRILVETRNTTPEGGEQHPRGKRSRHGHDRPQDRRGRVSARQLRNGVDQSETAYPVRLHRAQLEHNPGSDAVTSGGCTLDTEHVEQTYQSARVASGRQVGCCGSELGGIAPPKAEQIRYDDPITGWNQRHDARPKERRGRESVHEQERLTRSSGAAGVVVQPFNANIDEFAPHDGSRDL